MTTRRALARRSACVTCAAVLMMLGSLLGERPGVLAPFEGGSAHDGHCAAPHERHDVGDLRRALEEPVDVLAPADELDGVVLVRIAQHASPELLDDGLEL